MDTQQPTAAPERFIRLVKKGMEREKLSLRQLAEKAAVSPAYLSRLFNRERGLPSDDTIAKLEDVLNLDPPGVLFDAAGRHDPDAARFFRRDKARLLMRTLGPLTDGELAQVQRVAQRLANRHSVPHK